MSTGEATRTLDREALTEIHRSLAGRLRAHHVSRAFIERHAEDAVQRGVVEYLRAREGGVEVREPRAFVVQAAFRRAIDELRREARRADGSALEALLDLGREASPAAEELAIDHLDAARLRRAVASLPVEERQVLSLHYFGELSARRAGELLYMSERTFRRRLGDALADLGRMLGAPAGDPDPHRGLEIGLAAWASLGGARTVGAPGLLDHLLAAGGSLHRLPGRVLGRLRGTGTGLAASEAPERIGMFAGGPAGKVLGGCAGAAIVCAVSFSVGPGIGLGGGRSAAPPHGREATRPIRPRGPIRAHRKPASAGPGTSHAQADKAAVPSASPTPSRPARREPGPKVQEHSEAVAGAPPSEAEAAEEQFSGISRATQSAESESASTSAAESTSTTDSASSGSGGGQTGSTATSTEARAAQEQFHGVLSR